ncbi:hypothetical protein RDI86_01930 [Cellulosimicrobium sp. XJ-DQ-B-000]|uniref:hypothetical protein n=1 Tax=Cellulosimicrobium TaxID=157920 RepID=UPI002806BD83|nr:hypothetical protein [Cellulosimicrobium sp. XJ-DQ-B-000]MDQ8040606.1 hypothetical protein [Cellulosimicrobium sp. XJ-DQ-B-000]
MSTDVTLPSDRALVNPRSSEATAIEQSRAIAEVQAAVVVARQNPRNLDRAEAEMRRSCGRLAVANRAFYAVPNRGQGASVHLARELARVWGNIDYGVRELRRDDAAGESEMQAWAWDQETNVRSTRSFIQPHARMKGKTRQALTDLNDIYLGNQNTGARAVRECIFTVLPDWFVAEAEDVCRATIRDGEGTPLADRVAGAVSKFAEQFGISQKRLEDYVGKPKGNWTPDDLASLTTVYTSISREGINPDEYFPKGTDRVTAGEITGGSQ